MNRREDIITCARQLFEEQGLTKTSVRDITDRLGVTRSLFYHYFASKEDLTSAVLDSFIEEFVSELKTWNSQRRVGDIEHALDSLMVVLRNALFRNGSFRRALASSENAALYIEFVNRVADRLAAYIVDTTVQDYGRLHTIRIDHVYDTFYVLIVGIIGYMRQHPDVDDETIKDIIAQTLHMDRGRIDPARR